MRIAIQRNAGQRACGHFSESVCWRSASEVPVADHDDDEALLNSDEGMEAIKEAEGLSQRHRVDGVPFFIINGKITLGGAQPPEAFLEAFAQK